MKGKKRIKKLRRDKKDKKKDFIWYSLRISFGLMMMLLVISLFLKSIILNLIFFVSLIFTFVVSIIHFIKYKKGFAIVALVVSSLILLLYVIGLIVFSKINRLV